MTINLLKSLIDADPHQEPAMNQPLQISPPYQCTDTLGSENYPGTPELQKQRDEALKRLAAQVNHNFVANFLMQRNVSTFFRNKSIHFFSERGLISMMIVWVTRILQAV